MIKKTKLAILIATLVVSASFATAVTGQQTDDPIETIRQHYAEINQNTPRYRRVKKNLSGFSAEGGELVAYFHGPSIMKIVATFLGEAGKANEEYYFWNGRLIFVFRTEHRYDRPLSGKVVEKKESRFYFTDDKLVRWIDETGKQVSADASAYAEKQNDYLKGSKQLSDGARSANSTVEDKR